MIPLHLANAKTETKMSPGEVPLKQTNELFPKTRWSLVAQSRETEAGGKALAELCSIYWYPVYGYFRCRGKRHHDAQDLVQEFLCSLLRKKTFEQADQTRGKLREFLIFAAKRFLISSDRKDHRLKRGGGELPISLDAERAKSQWESEPIETQTPETHFERCWASTVLKTTMADLHAEYEAKGRSHLLAAMLPYLAQNARNEEKQGDVAERLGMTLKAFRMCLVRLRQRYQELLKETVADTLADPSEVDDELRHLRTLVGGN